jgi:hypothetical protein
MPFFRWQDIDHRLVTLRLVDLSQEMGKQIKADENQIRFENRLNLNGNTVPSLLMQMKEKHADDWARRVYEIYCEVWQIQGRVKSAAFIRGVSPHIVQMLAVRANSIAKEFSRFANATSLPNSLRTNHLTNLDSRMRQLQDKWQRRLEIEARECEHKGQSGVLTAKFHKGPPAESDRQPVSAETAPAVSAARRRSNKKQPGRPPRLAPHFVTFAGTLWRKSAIRAQPGFR